MFQNDNGRSCDIKVEYVCIWNERGRMKEKQTSPRSILSLGSILYLWILFLPGETTQPS